MSRRTVALFCTLAAIVAAAWVATPAGAGVSVGTETVSYGVNSAQRMTVYVPNKPGPHPAVLFVHGGCWTRGWVSGAETQVARSIAERSGWVVGVMSYRVTNESWASMPADVNAALRKLQSGFGVNPGRVALWGESAGGQLSLLTAYRGTGKPGLGRPRAVVSVAGPTDMPAEYANARYPQIVHCVQKFEGGPPTGHARNRYLNTSPVNAVSVGDPPTLLVSSIGDSYVLPSHQAELASRLQANGVPHRLYFVPGTLHSTWVEYQHVVGGYSVMRTAIQFLRPYLDGPVTVLSRV